MLVLHEILAFALFYHCFTRALKTNRNVKRDILVGFWLLGVMAVVAIFAPLSFGWRPDGMSLLMLTSILLVELRTSVHWRNGIPRAFLQKDSSNDQNRAGLA